MKPSIRCATPDDAAQIQAIYEPLVAGTAHSFETDPPDASEMRRRIEETLIRYPWLVSDDDGKILGYAYASPHRSRAAYRWSVDLAVYVHAEARRRGIGKALYRSLAAIVAHQGYHNAFAGIALPNPASIRLHQSLGFRSIAVYPNVGFKQNAWHSVSWWHLPLREAEESPQEPQALAAVQLSKEWPELLAAGSSTLA